MQIRHFINFLIGKGFPSLGLGIFFTLACSGQDGATPSNPLSLEDAVYRSLDANLGIRINGFAPEIAETAVDVEQAAFDTTLFSNANAGETERASIADATQGTSSSTRSIEIGASKRFSTGASAQITTNLTRSENNAITATSQLDYNSDFGVSLRQPLLRGAWTDVNLAPIKQAESRLAAARIRFNQQVFDLIAGVETAYWNLSTAFAQLDLRKTSLRTAEILLEEAREKERVGLATRVDLLQAEANRAQREEEIIVAEQAIADAADALFVLQGNLAMADGFIDRSVDVESLPEAMPAITPFETLWSRTLLWDLDIAIQQETLRQRNLDILLARNLRDPQLDLTLSGGQLGRDDQRGGTAVENALNGDGMFWRTGLQFSLPWGRREGEARVRQAEFRTEQEEIRLMEIKQALMETARRQWREANTGRRRLDAAMTTLELREATYEQAQARFKAGLITFREVLEAQDDLDRARLTVLNTRASVIRADIALNRLDGSIAERYRLTNLYDEGLQPDSP